MNKISKLAGLGLLCGLGLSSANALVVVTGDIAASTTWTAANSPYILEGSVANQGVIRVLSGATLTIQAGVVVRGQPRLDAATYNAGSLLVARGARINVQGTQSNPVIFTTAAVDNNADGEPDGFTRNGLPGSGAAAAVFSTRWSGAGDVFWDATPSTAPRCLTYTGLWGGVLVLGRAPTNVAFAANYPIANSASVYTEPTVEGLNVADPLNQYGGVFPGDNSGSITFASIRHGGIQLAADNEINGLTLAGVGNGTTINNVEIYGNEDDGIEIFGGTVNLRNIVIASTKDDGLDLDQGYKGNIQFGLVIGGSFMDKLNEWDGEDLSRPEDRATGFMYNMTFIGGPTANIANGAGILAQIRNGSMYRLQNSILTNPLFGPNTVAANQVSIQGTSAFNYFFRNVTVSGANSINANGVVENAFSAASPGYLPFAFTPCGPEGYQRPSFINPRPNAGAGGSGAAYLLAPAEQGVPPQFFQQVGYRGAFSNVAGVNPWTNGWTALNRAGIIPTL